MIEWLKEWPTRYAYFVLSLAWWTFLYNIIPWSMFSMDAPIQWMESHDKLSGWAQFVGATIGILIAIAVPAWQRYLQSLDKNRDTAELSNANALALFYLLGEVKNHLVRYVVLRHLPRSVIRDDEVRIDLLRRIHALELRDTEMARITCLFRARGFIHLTHSTMGAPNLQDRPISRGDLHLLRDRLAELDGFIKQASDMRDQAIDHHGRMSLFWLARKMYPTIARHIRKRPEPPEGETSAQMNSTGYSQRSYSSIKINLRTK